jgi:hypothetical protein
MRQANTAQTSQRAANVRIALLLAVVAMALFVVTFVAQGFAVYP